MGGNKALMVELASFKKRVGKVLGVPKIILFGSFAEGTATKESDVDLIIVSSKFNKLNFIERAALMYDYWRARKPVDFLCYTPKEFDSLSKRVTIVKHALQHGISL